MSKKCEKCAYFNRYEEKCYRWGYRKDCCEDCNNFEWGEKRLKQEELEKLNDEDLIEQYKANYKYANHWSGEADNDYIVPPKNELIKRGYKVNRLEVTK